MSGGSINPFKKRHSLSNAEMSYQNDRLDTVLNVVYRILFPISDFCFMNYLKLLYILTYYMGKLYICQI